MSSLPSNAPDPVRPVPSNGIEPRSTILVIEDDEGVRSLARRSLELTGYQVLEAADGEEGLRLVEKHADEVDLVLTDIDMPKIDGITVAMVLSALRPGLGVICMSGSLNRTVFQQSIGLPAQPFLAKPFTFEELAKETAETLARARNLLDRNNELLTGMRHYLTDGKPDAAVDLVAAGQRLRARAAMGGGTYPSIDSVQLPHDMEASVE